MIKIAVIDDGISTNKIYELQFNIEIDEDGRIIENCNSVQDYSHGTICAMIIKKYAPDALLGSIKILKSNTKRGYVNQFNKALEWCIQHNIFLINISLGSTQSYDCSIIYECVKNAYNNGIIIVAALSNKHVVTYPASFHNVIGVETDPLLIDDMYYMKPICIEGVNVVASSVHALDNKRTDQCNSYSAPLISAKVSKIMNEFGYLNIENIKLKLNENSLKKLEDYDPLFYPKGLFNSIESEKFKPIEIPSIMIKVENVQNKHVRSLNNKFNNNGYSTLFILSGESDIVETSYVMANKLSDKTLSYIASKYDADLIIIGFDSVSSSISNISCDILFYEEFKYGSSLNLLNTLLIDNDISIESKVGYKGGSDLVQFIYQKTIELLVT